MRELTKDECKSWRIRLEEAMPPAAFMDVHREVKSLTSVYNVIQPGLGFMRDAWTAGQFARARGADAVRLWPDYRPDCELTFGDRKELFEITEADQPLRKRSAEFRGYVKQAKAGFPPDIEELTDEEEEAEAANVPQMLETAARRKAAKNYDPSMGFVILLNFGGSGMGLNRIREALSPSTAPAKDAFREVWVLWQSLAYPTWRNGQAVPAGEMPTEDDYDE